VWLWLLVTRRFRAASVGAASAFLACASGVLFYGIDVFRAWMEAVGNVQWWWAGMNASLEGWLARLITTPGATTVTLPAAVAPLAAIGGVTIVAITLVRLRTRTIDESWTTLIAAALIASPLGWIYYGWWLFPGIRPSRLLVRAPMLWLPIAFVAFPQTHRVVAATLGSAYFWGLVVVWVTSLQAVHPRKAELDSALVQR
jgi:hypothetical protein